MPELRGPSVSSQAARASGASNTTTAPKDALATLRTPTVDTADVKAAERAQISPLTQSMIDGVVPEGAQLKNLLGDVQELKKLGTPPTDATRRTTWLKAAAPVLERAEHASAVLGNAAFFSGATHLKAHADDASSTVRDFKEKLDQGKPQSPARVQDIAWIPKSFGEFLDGMANFNGILGSW